MMVVVVVALCAILRKHFVPHHPAAGLNEADGLFSGKAHILNICAKDEDLLVVHCWPEGREVYFIITSCC